MMTPITRQDIAVWFSVPEQTRPDADQGLRYSRNAGHQNAGDVLCHFGVFLEGCCNDV